MCKYTILLLCLSFGGCQAQSAKKNSSKEKYSINSTIEFPEELIRIEKTEEEWKNLLDKEAFYVLRNKGTERAFTGDLWDKKESGFYICAACGLPLFDSDTKYDSGTGWPSFYKPVKKDYISEDVDYDIGYKRTEVLCARCGGHLGHVFPDGPKPTGLRYCINSVSLKFVAK